MKQLAAKIFAKIIFKRNQKWVNNPVNAQQETFQKLIASGSKTLFGKDHNFSSIEQPSV